MKKKHVELMRHYEPFIDRHRWPDYVLTAKDFMEFIRYEGTGKGTPHEALLWAKKVEEMTIQQMWHEMAEWWSKREGWRWVWEDNLRNAWEWRCGSNVMVRKILAQARLIKSCGGMAGAIMRCSAFSADDKQRYLKNHA